MIKEAKILIVDSDLLSSIWISDYFTLDNLKMDYNLTNSSRDCFDFLDCLEDSEKPDLIILDVHLPDLDGFKTLERLKEHNDYGEIPVVMQSKVESFLDFELSQKLGAHLFLYKPLTLLSFKKITATLSQFFMTEENTKKYFLIDTQECSNCYKNKN